MLRTENEHRVLGARDATTVHETGQASAIAIEQTSLTKSLCKTISHTACHRNDFSISFSKP